LATPTYAVSLGHSGQPTETAEAAETDEAATPFEAWLGEDGDPDDIDNILAFVMEHIGAEIDALKKERDEIEVRSTKDTNRKIAAVLRQQREARTVESAALAERLDRMAGQIGSLTRENAELKARLKEETDRRAQEVDRLEKEIARERALRRLLDAQRNRPHTQRVASELAKLHAAKALEVVTKSNKEEAA
jgi:hypothetical protein